MLDLIITNVRVEGWSRPVDIGIEGGRVAEIAAAIEADAPREDGCGAFACGGLVEPHLHLDKADILDRCPICDGTLAEAIALTAKAKSGFTRDDVRARATRIAEQAVLHGTTRLRSFVEIDPRAGFRSFEALLEVRRDLAFGIDIELCAFAQEGLTQEPETIGMLDEALAAGADLVGGCPYTDPDPVAHVDLIFDLAEKYGTAVDFHADFDLDPDHSILPEIARQTAARGFAGRVSVGHATKLAAMGAEQVSRIGELLAASGIAVTALPSTDLFLLGRGVATLVPRGVTPLMRLKELGVLVTLGSNNILNPFTPYGDASLLRMANLFANVAQLSRDADLAAAFDMVSAAAARQLGASYGIAVGNDADIVLLDAESAAMAVRTLAPVRAGWKRGRKSFEQPRPVLFRPQAQATP
jgi:cytosine deaminase